MNGGLKERGTYLIFLRAFAALTVLTLVFIIIFIVRESLPLFHEVSLTDFLLGENWKPVSYSGPPSYGIAPLIISTLFVSAIAVALAGFIGVGAALFLACVATERMRGFFCPFIDLLAGIPSVVYGFVGLRVIVKFFQKLGRSSGESILAAGLLLAVMILPFLISSCTETMLRIRRRYLPVSDVLGVSKWYALCEIVLPLSRGGILTSLILGVGRAMGETMAVMMVIGNAPIFPTLLGKGETIAALIALEMGTAEVNSTHFRALYAAGLTLMVLLMAINGLIAVIRQHTIGRGDDVCGKRRSESGFGAV